MSYKYKLASVLLSTGLIMAACGSDGEEEEEESTDNMESSEETEQGTDTSSSEGSSGNDENVDDTSPDEETDESDEIQNDDEEDNAESNTSDDKSEKDSGSSSNDTVSQDDIKHEAQEAVDKAKESFDGKLIKVGLDHDENQWVYKVDLEQETEDYEAKLSVEDLSVINESIETDDDKDSEDQFEYSQAVPAEEAVQTAIEEAGGSSEIEGWELDKDDGRLEYKIELKNTDGDDVDIKIDGESGEVIETDSDKNDDGDDNDDNNED